MTVIRLLTPFSIPFGKQTDVGVIGRDICLKWTTYDLYKLETKFVINLQALGFSPMLDISTTTVKLGDNLNYEENERVIFVLTFEENYSDEEVEALRNFFDEIMENLSKRDDFVGIASLSSIGIPVEWIENVIPCLTFSEIHVEKVSKNKVEGFVAYAKVSPGTYIDDSVRINKKLVDSLESLYESNIIHIKNASKEILIENQLIKVGNYIDDFISGSDLYKFVSTYSYRGIILLILKRLNGYYEINIPIKNLSNIKEIKVVNSGNSLNVWCPTASHLIAVLRS